MFGHGWWKYIAVALPFTLLALSCGKPPEVQRISKEELRPLLDARNLIILDVIREEDWKLTERKIEGAVRRPPEEVESWAEEYSKDQPLVLYCS